MFGEEHPISYECRRRCAADDGRDECRILGLRDDAMDEANELRQYDTDDVCQKNSFASRPVGKGAQSQKNRHIHLVSMAAEEHRCFSLAAQGMESTAAGETGSWFA